MTENSDWFSQVDEAEEHLAESTPTSEQILTLQLPPDLALALQRRCQQLGQTQAEVILALLRSAMQLPSAPAWQTVDQSELAANQLATQQEVHSLKARLSQLEELIPRLEALEGKWVAF